jgi:hypothetical protein
MGQTWTILINPPAKKDVDLLPPLIEPSPRSLDL